MSDIIAGRAELLDPLAHGATGTLWRALDLRYDQVCAAKVMRQRDGADMLRFVREQSVGARGGHAIGPHPHLLLPYTWAAEDDAIVLLMPLLHGGTLEQSLSDHGALHPLLVLELTRQVLDALAAVHAAGWVHRDLKPANLLLEVTGSQVPHLRLTDFGIALHHDDARLTDTGMVPGTPGYLAPEVLFGRLDSPAQDLWATGVIALRAVDPRTDPRSPQRLDAALERAFSGPVGDLPGARELADVITRLLSQDPADRGSAEEVRALIRPPGLPSSAWVLTSDGEPFEVFEQIEPAAPGSPAATLSEIPHNGPDADGAAPRGLHDRLSQRAAAASTPPATDTPATPPVTDATGTTNLSPVSGPARPTPAAPVKAAPASRRWPVVLLCILAALALIAAILLGVFAARASAATAGTAGPQTTAVTASAQDPGARP